MHTPSVADAEKLLAAAKEQEDFDDQVAQNIVRMLQLTFPAGVQPAARMAYLEESCRRVFHRALHSEDCG
jgi:Flp pilus assembly protein TadD